MSYGVKVGQGTVTHWAGTPLATRELAEKCAEAIERYTGETGAVVEVPCDCPDDAARVNDPENLDAHYFTCPANPRWRVDA